MQVLKRHVVAGRRMDNMQLRNGERVVMMWDELRIKQTQGEVLLEWQGHLAKLTSYDLAAVNGVVHVIDQVLFDPKIDAKSYGQKVLVNVFMLLSISCVSMLWSR